MSQHQNTIRAEDFAAYADGELKPHQRVAVATAVAQHVEHAKLLQSYEVQRAALSALRVDILEERTPHDLLEACGKPRSLKPGSARVIGIAAAAGLACAGFGLGWLTSRIQPKAIDATQTYIADAIQRHRRLVHEKLETPEFENDDDFFASVGSPFSAPVRWASLRNLKLTPYAYRQIKSETAMAGMVYYRDEMGTPLSVYVRQTTRVQSKAFSVRREGEYGVATWPDGPLTYIVVGQMPADRVTQIGRTIYGSPAILLRSPAEPKD